MPGRNLLMFQRNVLLPSSLCTVKMEAQRSSESVKFHWTGCCHILGGGNKKIYIYIYVYITF